LARLTRFTFILAFVFVGFNATAKSAGNDDPQLTIDAVGNLEPGEIWLRFANFTDHAIVPMLTFIGQHYYFRFEVRNGEGDLVQYTGIEYKKSPAETDYLLMAPGSVYSQRIDLRQYFELASGVYTVMAHYDFRRGGTQYDFVWTGELTSNQIEIEIP
jgi:hypothetical protein